MIDKLVLPQAVDYHWKKVNLTSPVDGFDIRYEKFDNRSSNPSKIQYRHPGLESLFGPLVEMPNDTLNPLYFVHPCFQDEAKWRSEASNYRFTFGEILRLYKRSPEQYDSKIRGSHRDGRFGVQPDANGNPVYKDPCSAEDSEVIGKKWRYNEALGDGRTYHRGVFFDARVHNDMQFQTPEEFERCSNLTTFDVKCDGFTKAPGFKLQDPKYGGWPSHAILSSKQFGTLTAKGGLMFPRCAGWEKGAYSYKPPPWAINAMRANFEKKDARGTITHFERVIFYAYFNAEDKYWIYPKIPTLRFTPIIQSVYATPGSGIDIKKIKWTTSPMQYQDIIALTNPGAKRRIVAPGGSRKLRRRFKTPESQTRKTKQSRARKNKTYKNKSRKRRNSTS
jgi:hypothetical protein